MPALPAGPRSPYTRLCRLKSNIVGSPKTSVSSARKPVEMELIALGLFLLLLYGGVRLLASAVSRSQALGTARTGSSPSNTGADMRVVAWSIPRPSASAITAPACAVGLAPVVPGQPAPPRTRVVARFPAGLPFRLELMPHGRPSPPQPPKGTRPVRTGITDFDRSHIIQANDPDMAREFLQPTSVRTSLGVLRKLGPPNGFLLSINPERLLVQVDRNVAINSQHLITLVRETLVLHDCLQNSVAAQLSLGVDVVPTDPDAAKADLLGPPECQICGTEIEGPHVVCDSCNAPFHRDCWSFVGGCATFGCTGKRCHSS